MTSQPGALGITISLESKNSATKQLPLNNWRNLVTYVIAEPCVDVKDKSCIEECPVDCIYEGSRMLYIQPDECVDCGACEPVCPVEAIYYEDDVPAQWNQFGKINTEFFVEIGSPGGASKVGQTNTDHATVVALPAKSE